MSAKKTILLYTTILIISALLVAALSLPADARVAGLCTNCHTMHNSQNKAETATFGYSGNSSTGTGPFPMLVKGDCMGCHGMGTANNIDPLTNAPQVFHQQGANGVDDLAGGNFAYITGLGSKTSAADANGHNIIDLGNPDGALNGPPGAYLGANHDTFVTDSNLTCAGARGCHGVRDPSKCSGAAGSPCPEFQNLNAMQGAHHNDVEGQIDGTAGRDATEDYNSYRFLFGVYGLENPTSPWENVDASDHNEYFGANTPPGYKSDCSNACHSGGLSTNSVSSKSHTMSGLCGTCHGNFHGLDTGDFFAPILCEEGCEGIGTTTSSPFRRHPTDIELPNTDEYASYNPNNPGAFSIEAPVARLSVPAVVGATVTPGTDAVVMCLTCHKAHASQYPDMLRWDYTKMTVGAGAPNAGTGCFTCHTDKDGV
jgi:predicted CXXCH cytochrome family protein